MSNAAVLHDVIDAPLPAIASRAQNGTPGVRGCRTCRKHQNRQYVSNIALCQLHYPRRGDTLVRAHQYALAAAMA
jgi:hypothetical protein